MDRLRTLIAALFVLSGLSIAGSAQAHEAFGYSDPLHLAGGLQQEHFIKTGSYYRQHRHHRPRHHRPRHFGHRHYRPHYKPYYRPYYRPHYRKHYRSHRYYPPYYGDSAFLRYSPNYGYSLGFRLHFHD